LYELLFLKIIPGKPYMLSTQNKSHRSFKPPEGFDSIALYNEEEKDSGLFKHDYILFDNEQVLPCNIVHFEFDKTKEELLKPPLCDLCEESTATVYCESDEAALCYECDSEQHNQENKLLSRHVRVKIHERPKNFGKCDQHIEMKLDFFCTVCQTPICVYCKISGSHSTGEALNHPLLKIQDAYRKSLEDSKEVRI